VHAKTALACIPTTKKINALQKKGRMFKNETKTVFTTSSKHFRVIKCAKELLSGKPNFPGPEKYWSQS